MLSVVLLEPESAGNIGFIARAMENFNFKDLRLVKPNCDLNQEAFSRAMHAQETLESAREFYSLESATQDLDFLVGTTGIRTGDRNLTRTGVRPSELASKLPKSSKTGLLFGRESKGLSNEELDLCDFVVRIPTSEDYPVMNLSHAAAIILYQIYREEQSREEETEERDYSLEEEKEVMEKLFKAILSKLGYSSQRQKKSIRCFKNIMGRAFITNKEAHLLLGVLKDINRKIKEKKR